jgi:uncharacterized membrane protein YadS
VVKLTRVIWILPLALLAAWWEKRARAAEAGAGGAEATTGTANAPFPWFILFFLAASALRTFVPSLADVGDETKFASGWAQVALFLIAAALPVARQGGLAQLVQAVLLWLALAGVTLLVVMYAGV